MLQTQIKQMQFESAYVERQSTGWAKNREEEEEEENTITFRLKCIVVA